MTAEDVLTGVRVVDLSDGMAGPLATMVLADHGAEVLKVEPPGGDRARCSPGFPFWNRGKRGLVLDVGEPAELARLRELIATADVVVESFRPGVAASHGLDAESLRRDRPELIVCSIEGFGHGLGLDGDLLADDAVVGARSGRFAGNDHLSGSHVGRRPIFVAAPANAYGAAMLAVQGIVATLLARERTGRGDHVSTSLLDGVSAATMRLAFEREGDRVVPVGQRGSGSSLVIRGIAIAFMTARCADGRYIQMCARQDHHFRNWFAAMGLSHVLEEPRFARAPMGLTSFEDADELEARARARMAERTQTEWMDLFIQHDVGADPFLTFDEFLEHPQMTLNDRVVTVDDPDRGPVTQVGALAVFDDSPPPTPGPAPRLGEHQGELDELVSVRGGHRRRQAPGPERALPLAGLTVVEAAYFLAAPLGPTLLAELGARVIKVEPPSGDPFRRTGLEFVHLGAGKESLAVDVKSADGRDVVHRLVARADAFVTNFRAGVPERLGIGYEDLRRVNPRLVYCYAASYGSKGPQRSRAAFHSTPNALSGGGVLQGGVGNPPIDESYPDPVAGLGVATAVALGLLRRERMGRGCYVETSMLASTGYVHGARLTRWDGAPELPLLDGEQRGLHALYRLYQGSDERWFLLAALDAPARRALARATGLSELAEPSRSLDDSRATALLDKAFGTEPAGVWADRLVAAGVSAALVPPSLEEFLVEAGLTEEREHPAFGTYWGLRPRIQLRERATTSGPTCALGEHSLALLAELGFDDGEAAALVGNGVVRAWSPQP